MTRPDEFPCRTVTFGDLGDGPWGVLVSGSRSFSVLGAGDRRASSAAGVSLDRTDPAEDWQLAAEDIELTIFGSGEAVRVTDEDRGRDLGFDQLCHVRGKAQIGDEQQTIDAFGLRGARAGTEFGGSGSVRGAWAWFEPGHGLALVAIRPRKRRGHDRDAVTASVLEPTVPAAVAEPRLSTTYGTDGAPLRAGLELWLEQDSEQYPRRAAGEAVAFGDPIIDQDLDVRTALMRWHIRGREGAGMYVVARSR